MPSGCVRIGNAHAFWGDRIDAAAEMLRREPDLDFLTLDFLAEVSMSILALQRDRDPQAGFARDFIDVVASLAAYWKRGGRCRVIANAGGLNPRGCAEACRQVLADAGVGGLTIAVVSGDDVLELLRADAEQTPDAAWLKNLDTARPLGGVAERLVTANAYLGAAAIAESLDRGADLVITGRVADPSLTVGACLHHFGWAADDWNRLAGATVAGHLIECGTQVTGGISTDWLILPDVSSIGFPIVEVADDGSCVATKPRGTGGCVSEQTVKEQLVYEIGDPGRYLSPDVTVSFLPLSVTDFGNDRVAVSGATGSPPPASYKVSATYRDGYRAAGTLTVIGHDAVSKARRAADALFDSLARRGITFQHRLVECLGTGQWTGLSPALAPGVEIETVLRIAVADRSRRAAELFARDLTSLITAGPPGTTGYAEGRPRMHPVFRYWPCLIDRKRVTPLMELLSLSGQRGDATSGRQFAPPTTAESNDHLDHSAEPEVSLTSEAGEMLDNLATLRDVAFARSGDKGINANVGVLARRPRDFDWLCQELTVARVAEHFGIAASRVQRFELPNLAGLNFILQGILENPLRTDAQGKALAQVLLELPLESGPPGYGTAETFGAER
ncbi:acyclic terpene utilization AtuA family protein [bacterium]|nr:acyclic terpene utilization AtuA family protein [bacterium]